MSDGDLPVVIQPASPRRRTLIGMGVLVVIGVGGTVAWLQARPEPAGEMIFVTHEGVPIQGGPQATRDEVEAVDSGVMGAPAPAVASTPGGGLEASRASTASSAPPPTPATTAPGFEATGPAARPGAGASSERDDPWFEEDWSLFSGPTDFDGGGPRGNILSRMISMYARDNARDGEVGVEMGLTDTPWGGDRAARVTFNDRSVLSCSEGHGPEVGVRMELPDADADRPREIWFESWMRFDPDWTTRFCPGQHPEHKLLMHYDNDYRRWNLMMGASDNLSIRPYINNWDASGAREIEAKDPPNGGPGDRIDSSDLWDGAWHRIRGHYRMGQGNGVIELWLGDRKIFDQRGLRSEDDGNAWFKYVYLSSYMNHRPDREMSVYFGRYRVWISDPGW